MKSWLIGLALLASLPLYAQSVQYPEGAQSLPAFPLSKTQFLASYSRNFDAMDLNKDGWVTLDEINAYRVQVMSARGGTATPVVVAKFGFTLPVSKAGYLQYFGKDFDLMDSNSDGLLSWAEVQAYTNTKR